MEEVRVAITFSEPYKISDIKPIVSIAEEDINDYCRQLNLKYVFKSNIYYTPMFDHNYTIDILGLTRIFHDKGINFLIGHQSSFYCNQVLNYTNANGPIMISPYSSDDTLSIRNDSLFRLKCRDSNQGRIMAEMLKDCKKQSVVIINLNVPWGNAIKDEFIKKYGSENVYSIISYDYKYNRTSILIELNNKIEDLVKKQELSNTAIVGIGIFDLLDILQQIDEYPTLKNISWVGTDAIVSKLVQEEFELGMSTIQTQIKILCPNISPQYSSRFVLVDEKYYAQTGEHLDFVESAIYDAYWIYALSIIQSNSLDPKNIKNIIPNTTSNYKGLTGTIKLDEFGDRENANYEIFELSYNSNSTSFMRVGNYNSTLNKILWKP
jgi:ABC-type branched-subunit amino acid transport system substrate-binding protein